MKSRIVASALLALTLAVPSFAETRWNISIGNAPPPPRIYAHPHWRYVSGPDVYVIADERLPYDMFRYGDYYYVYNDDFWYRSPRPRGPFRAIRVDYIPQPIWAMSYEPDYRWRHRPNVPPQFARNLNNHRYANQWDRGRDRDRRHGDRDRDRQRGRDRNRDWDHN
jgi:hypothetical protein